MNDPEDSMDKALQQILQGIAGEEELIEALEKALREREILAEELAQANRRFEERVQDLSLIKRIEDALKRAADVETICEVVVDAVMQETSAERCFLLMVDRDSGELDLKLAKGYMEAYDHPTEIGSVPRQVRRVAGEVIRTHNSVLIEHAARDERFESDYDPTAGIGSLLCFPLITEDEVVGVVSLSHPHRDAFDRDDRRAMALIVDLISIALSNVRLLDQLERMNHALEGEVERRTGQLTQAYEDLKETQDQLIQAAKLSTIGQVASGIVHELSQPIMVIRGLSQSVLQRWRQARRDHEEIELILKSTERMIKIVDQIRSFSRLSPSDFRLISLNQVVDNVLGMVGKQLQVHNVRLVLRQDPALPYIVGDMNQLEQVVLNLIVNARDAMEGQPERVLTIGTSVVEEEDRVQLEVRDIGVGIPEGDMDRIFDPFFTTKTPDRGTGLGLSISASIVHRHNGSIEFRSKEHTGTTFTVLLPIEGTQTKKDEDK